MELCGSFPDIEIGSFQLTPRELDVISGLASGHSAKFFANLIEISPKTMEAHVHNIAIKMVCNSKEQILDIVDKFDLRQYFKERYENILAENSLKKVLKNVASKNKSEATEPCYVLCQRECKNKKNCRLARHLQLAGIPIETKQRIGNTVNTVFIPTSDFLGEESSIPCKNWRSYLILVPNATPVVVQARCIYYHERYAAAVLEVIQHFYHYKVSKQDKGLLIVSNQDKNFPMSFRRSRGKIAPYKINFLSVGVFILIFGSIVLFLSQRTAPLVSPDIPFIKKEHLLERSRLIREMGKLLKKQTGVPVLVIVGPGGAGKTTIARQYAKNLRNTFIFEINAETDISLSSSLTNLAYLLANTHALRQELQFILAITDQLEQSKQRIVFIQKRLSTVKRWGLIFDNVKSFQGIRDNFPYDEKKWGHGIVILTTQNSNIQNVGHLTPSMVLHIEKLDEKEKNTLFKQIFRSDEESNWSVEKEREIQDFLVKIPSFPLDISAAAHYIKNTEESFDAYANMIVRGDQAFESMQSDLLGEELAYNKTRYRIIFSSFQKILEKRLEFKELLLLVCLVDSQNISKELLHKCVRLLNSQVQSETLVDDFIYQLKQYSLIFDNGACLSMHRSAQKIGLSCILSLLSDTEKREKIDHIVKMLTPFEQICWPLYKGELENVGSSAHLLLHLKSIEHKIKNIACNIQQCSTRILLALGHLLHSNRNKISEAVECYKSVLSIENLEKYISARDLSALFLNLGYDSVLLGDTVQAKQHLKKGLELAESSTDNEALLSMGAVKLATLYNNDGNFDECLRLAQRSIDIVESCPERWAHQILTEAYHILFVAYLEHYYVTKPECKIGLDYASKILKLHNADPPFSKREKKLPDKFPSMAFFIRRGLSNFYGVAGLHRQGLEEINEAAYILKHYEKDGDYLVPKLWVLREESGNLIGLGKFRIAEKKLSYVIDNFRRMGMNRYAMFALEYRIYARGYLNKSVEGYEDCLQFLNFGNYGKSNDYVIRRNKIEYHAAVFKFRQGNQAASIKHFATFFQNMNEFCRNFFEKEKYDELNKANAFEIIKDPTKIGTCFENALKIFTAIYGADHGFVKNFVAQKGKANSWFSILIKQLYPLMLRHLRN
ncbi:MAG: LuxR C-terminal-related transcriptional regulator [Holosporales bacterium]|jgi:DNA-binding CsgD family transcriptional regulator/tetratricopeptide (TPR) repeat protein|nr:LuxR C-terminal-related transcriptional regulator [Holosporales bacterium]